LQLIVYEDEDEELFEVLKSSKTFQVMVHLTFLKLEGGQQFKVPGFNSFRK
jgi:hypothetical protein